MPQVLWQTILLWQNALPYVVYAHFCSHARIRQIYVGRTICHPTTPFRLCFYLTVTKVGQFATGFCVVLRPGVETPTTQKKKRKKKGRTTQTVTISQLLYGMLYLTFWATVLNRYTVLLIPTSQQSGHKDNCLTKLSFDLMITKKKGSGIFRCTEGNRRFSARFRVSL